MEKELEQMQAVYQLITEFFINYSFQILGAIIILLVGVLVARKVGDIVFRLCERKNLDITLSRFIGSSTKIIIIVMVAIIALGKVGISVTPFVAAIGALSLGAGLAVQGLLSNYGAGLNIILTRPFIVGDTIRVQGVAGLVKEVHLAYTLLTDEDDVEITIPNRHIVGEILHNSHEDTLAEEIVRITYDSDPDEAVSIIQNVLKNDEQVSTKKEPMVGIEEFAVSHINIGIRFWAPTMRYFVTKYEVNHAIYTALKDAGIKHPIPQHDIRVIADEPLPEVG